ncbi:MULTISPECIES: TetR/AcrR family transcriptional regulator [Tsukamurella]|uniref:Helix-turn-helix domain-containing protein n=1 Tax=Tsukamurella strandjordii TaxID=147577 RepID=A0AA90SMG0_9ACTN|nr:MULTISPECIES: TetR/AcrR family transcriptional regulator [Tsukamurella]MDP0399307.1 helix-turn-helix domain-containing protein [Tsukamurella strandjordii]GIZ95465.1 putative transcriptional regulator, TetR family protein [Tsukamurella sp. TY48]
MSETALTREAIVAEAVRLADEGGLEKVSMRRIAEALGTGAMSLYRHVPDKETLIREMAAAVGAGALYPEELLGDPDWRRRVHIAAETDLRLYLRHPWVLLAHAVPRAAVSPSSVACFDWLVEALDHLTGKVDDSAELALHVWNHVQGAGLGAVGRVLVAPGSSLDGVGFVAGLADDPLIEELPRMRDLVAIERPELCEALPLLRSGIEALCDGFAARYGDRSTPLAPPTVAGPSTS